MLGAELLISHGCSMQTRNRACKNRVGGDLSVIGSVTWQRAILSSSDRGQFQFHYAHT